MSIMTWKFFNKETIEIVGNERRAQCILCDSMISFKEITDLKHHLVKYHSNYVEMLEIKKNTKPRGYLSAAWNHFRRTDCKYFAECNYCKKMFSYKSTKGNLKKHILKTHPEVDYDAVPTNKNYNSVINDNEDSENVHSEEEQRNNENATEQDQEAEKDDVWNYFEKIPSNRAQCILCKETFNRHVPFLAKHLSEKHRKVALDLPSDSDDDQNCYTEVVYLEEEQPIDVATKLKKVKQVPEPKKRRTSSRYEFVNKPKDDEIDSKNEVDDEIENFGRYVIGLLKKLPKDVSTQLQMDIISMIMTAKLKIQTPTIENVTVSSVQIVTPGNDIVTTPGNVIVTTPSNVIHTTQNNESLPTLVIGVQKET